MNLYTQWRPEGPISSAVASGRSLRFFYEPSDATGCILRASTVRIQKLRRVAPRGERPLVE
jgi:hypothetical protein